MTDKRLTTLVDEYRVQILVAPMTWETQSTWSSRAEAEKEVRSLKREGERARLAVVPVEVEKSK